MDLCFKLVNGVVCEFSLNKPVKKCWREAGADKFQEIRGQSGGGWGGADPLPGTPTTSMTWALHLDKSCRPRKARSNSSRYSSSDFWLSSPEPVTTWGTLTITFTANEPGTFPLYFTDPLTPKNTAREVLLLYLLTDKLKLRQVSCWSHGLQMTEGSNSGAMMPEPHSQRPWSIAEQWLFRLLGLWVFHKETVCLILETSSDCPLSHTKMLIRDQWQPTPVFLPGKSHGQRSLVGYSQSGSQRVGHDWATSLSFT